MANVTGLWSSYGVGWGTGNATAGNREMALDIITIIDPDEAPTLAVIGKTTTNSLYHDYSIDTLNATSTAGAVEGADWTSNGEVTVPTRIQNWVQRFRKNLHVSEDQLRMSRNGRQIGVDDAMRIQIGKAHKELTRNISARLWSKASASTTAAQAGNDSGVTGSTSVASEMRNFHWFARSGGGGAATIMTANQAGAFGTAKFYELQAAMWNAGAKPDTLFVSGPVKVQVSRTLLGDASYPVTQSGAQGLSLVNANGYVDGGTYGPVIDVVRTDYGRVAVVMDRWIPALGSSTGTTALVDDAKYYLGERNKMRAAWWKPITPTPLPPNGPSVRAYVEGALTVEVLHPSCLGAAYAVTA